MLKATVLIENLKEGITQTQHAISSRSPVPVLLNFLIEATDDNLIISATDLEIGIRVKIPAKVEGEGAITVPAKTFTDLISNVTQEKVGIEEKEGGLVLTASKLKTQFPTLSASEFPKLYEDKGEKQAEFTKKVFDNAISRVAFAAATDSTRPALSGVLVKREGKGITLVATDGYRLSLKKEIDVKDPIKSEGDSLLVSARVIKEVSGAKGDIKTIGLHTASSSNQILFDLGDTEIVGRLIEAEYPDYQKIIPQDLATKVEFDRAEALAAVRSCSVFAREAANIIKIAISKDKMVFSASASGAGENEVEIEAKTTGEENEIAFNARYLLDFLTNIDEETLTFEMTGPLNSGVFRVAGDNSYLHLIMPIRVQS
jgi:DNA polymerase III subunit beta